MFTELTSLVHRMQALLDRLESDEEKDLMTYQIIMSFWLKPRTKLIHDYSIVGYIFSPNPGIMNDARERMLHIPIYSNAIKCLIGKLTVTDNLSSRGA
jgi:hypothetical protein